MRFLSRSAKLFPATLLGSALLILGAVGCGTDGASGPDAVPVYTADSPPPILRGPTAGLGIATGDTDFYHVASKVMGGDGGVLVGNRYRIRVPANAVDDDVLFKISERHPDLLDVQFDPHGMLFDVPVKVYANITGTNADPAASLYNAATPVFYWFNDVTGVWEEMQSTIYYRPGGEIWLGTELPHFSRYAVGGGPTPPGDGTADW